MPDTRLSPTAGTTEAALVTAVSNDLRARPYSEAITAAYTAGGTSLTVATDATTRTTLAAGLYIDFAADGTYDILQMTAIAATTITVVGGLFGSTSANHANGARFQVMSRYGGLDVQRAINDSVASDLYPDLYAVYEQQLSPTTTWAAETTLIKEIDATAEQVLDELPQWGPGVYQKTDTTPTKLMRVMVSQPFYIDATLAATHKKAVELRYIPDPNNTIFLRYIRKPAIADLSDAMARIVRYGACARLLEWEAAGVLATDKIAQSGTQAPGAHTRTAAWYWNQVREMRAREKALLDHRYPRRRPTWVPRLHVRY